MSEKLVRQKVKIVAFVGKAGSGKTTAAQYLTQYRNYTKLRLADGLKKMLIDGLGIDPEYIDGDKKNMACDELCGKTGRFGMMTLGTEWGRNLIHSDIWVVQLDKKIHKCIANGITKIVIDDVRFLNESMFLDNMQSVEINTTLIRLIRDSKKERIKHQSETEQDKIAVKYEIVNDGVLGELYMHVDKILDLEFKKE